MENTGQAACKCPNTKCPRNGDCKACIENHKGKKMYCKLKDGSFRKWLMNRLYRSA